MSMSKKDFIALADHIRYANGLGVPHLRFSPEQINHLADFCKDCNPNFMVGRWIDYINGQCGPNGGRVNVH